MKILVGPSDEETDAVFNEMTPDDALIWSIENNLPDYIKKAIERGADVNKQDKYSNNPLHFASAYNKLDMVKILIKNGANINNENNNGWTPLHIASYYGRLNTVKLLVENGADVNIKNTKNEDVLSIFLKNNNIDMLLYLIKNGADVKNIPNDIITEYYNKYKQYEELFSIKNVQNLIKI
jgi:ankyrin repeat protein